MKASIDTVCMYMLAEFIVEDYLFMCVSGHIESVDKHLCVWVEGKTKSFNPQMWLCVQTAQCHMLTLSCAEEMSKSNGGP